MVSTKKSMAGASDDGVWPKWSLQKLRMSDWAMVEGPKNTCWPCWLITSRWVKMRMICGDGWCSDSSTALALDTPAMSSVRYNEAAAERPVVGSSSSRICEEPASSTALEMSLCCEGVTLEEPIYSSAMMSSARAVMM